MPAQTEARTRARTLGALFAIALLAGCTRSGARWDVPGEVRIGFLGTLTTLDPLIAFGQREIDLTQLFVQPLIGISARNRPIPVLCTEVPSRANGGISRDGLTITYHLRRNVRFADGVPLTSRDVAFTYRAILNPRNPVTEAEPYRRIAALTTPDAHTVVIRLKHRWAGAVDELFAASDYIYGILPAHAFSSTDVTHAAWNDAPFGTGPFRVVAWTRGQSVLLEPNPYARPAPKLRKVVIDMVADENTAFVDLQAHAIDFTDITDQQARRARSMPGIAVVAIPRNATDFLELQTQAPVLRARRVRRAIAYAVDRTAIARDVYLGSSPLASTEIPPLFAEHDDAIHARTFDPERARRLLAGRHPFVRIAFDLSERTYAKIAALVQANLRAVGFRAVQRGANPSLYYAPPANGGILYDGRFEIDVGGWYGGLDPEASEEWTCANRAPRGPNAARWCDRRYDAAFAAQQRTLNVAARTREFAVMQRRVHAALPVIPLVYRTEFDGVNPALRGFHPNMLYNFGAVQDWQMR